MSGVADTMQLYILLITWARILSCQPQEWDLLPSCLVRKHQPLLDKCFSLEKDQQFLTPLLPCTFLGTGREMGDNQHLG